MTANNPNVDLVNSHAYMYIKFGEILSKFVLKILSGNKILFYIADRALTRILKTGVQDSHLAKSRSPTGNSGSPTPKKLESRHFVHTIYVSILAGSDSFE